MRLEVTIWTLDHVFVSLYYLVSPSIFMIRALCCPDIAYTCTYIQSEMQKAAFWRKNQCAKFRLKRILPFIAFVCFIHAYSFITTFQARCKFLTISLQWLKPLQMIKWVFEDLRLSYNLIKINCRGLNSKKC